MPNLNEYVLLKKSPSKSLGLIIFIAICFIMFFLTYFVKISDSTSFTGIIECQENCQIELLIPVEKMDILNHQPSLLYQSKVYKIENINISELTFNNDIPAAKVLITSNINVSFSNFIDIKLQYNKQRKITKLYNLIIGKE